MSLKGKNGLIVGIANRNSVAYGCAEVLRAAGAELAVTYLNAKAQPFVRPLAEHLGSPIVIACDAAWLGVDLDQSANSAGGMRITHTGSRTSVWVIPTDEDLMIALHAWALLNPEAIPHSPGNNGSRNA